MNKEPSIFELTQISYLDYEKPRYPKFNVHRLKVGYYSSLANAEQAMTELASKDRKSIFGFLVNEYPLDICAWGFAKSRRNYLSDGSLWDESLVSEIETDGKFESFYGRPPEKMRFKIGDLVEVLYGDSVHLEIIGDLPCTPEKCNKMYQRSEVKELGTILLDHSDDSYYTLDQKGEHGHPRAATLFPARLKISSQISSKFNNHLSNLLT